MDFSFKLQNQQYRKCPLHITLSVSSAAGSSYIILLLLLLCFYLSVSLLNYTIPITPFFLSILFCFFVWFFVSFFPIPYLPSLLYDVLPPCVCPSALASLPLRPRPSVSTALPLSFLLYTGIYKSIRMSYLYLFILSPFLALYICRAISILIIFFHVLFLLLS